jgi:hypothetical protein
LSKKITLIENLKFKIGYKIFSYFSFVAITTKIRNIRDNNPQKIDPKKIVDRMKKNTSKLVILLKNRGLAKN